MWICITYWSHDCINLGNDYHDLSVPCYEPLSGSFFIRLHTQYATFTFLDHETYIGTRIDVKLPQKWSSVFFMGRRGLTKMLPLLLSPECNEPSTLLQHDNMSDRLFLSFKCVQMFDITNLFYEKRPLYHPFMDTIVWLWIVVVPF